MSRHGTTASRLGTTLSRTSPKTTSDLYRTALLFTESKKQKQQPRSKNVRINSAITPAMREKFGLGSQRATVTGLMRSQVNRALALATPDSNTRVSSRPNFGSANGTGAEAMQASRNAFWGGN